uniref:Uncharacterized protein n=1 Tax=Octopus bimaculoides TaxID=37653 RepID=A0A0L8FZW0_OCTBM
MIKTVSLPIFGHDYITCLCLDFSSSTSLSFPCLLPTIQVYLSTSPHTNI